MTRPLFGLVAFGLLFAAVVFPDFGDFFFIAFFGTIGLMLAAGLFLKWRDGE